MAKYTVHGGHAAHGKKNCGAVGYCSESLVDRQIKDAVIKYLKLDGHLIKDCTVDSGLTQSSIITAIKKLINSDTGVTANVSIHLNASKKSSKDGKNKGVECCVYSTNSTDAIIANSICKAIARLGFTNRGVKARTNLGVLKGIKNGGANILVECFFCDDEDDYILYTKLGADAIGKAIAEGVVGHDINAKKDTSVEMQNYIYDGVDYSKVFNPSYYALKNSDLKKVYGENPKDLFTHFLIFGMKEGRIASPDFNVQVYKERYIDLKKSYGQSLPEYYKHYCTFGYSEGRKAI